jgi:hypothetical protein
MNQPFVVPSHPIFHRGSSYRDGYTPISAQVNPAKIATPSPGLADLDFHRPMVRSKNIGL